MTQLKVSTEQIPNMIDQPRGLVLPPGYPPDYPPDSRLETAINAFEPIRLQEMDAVALLNRVDTKFALSMSQLVIALQSVRPYYRILNINRQKMHRYQTLYYDTRNFELYHDHVTERADAYKVRSREYVDTRLAYLEVKHKNQKKRTEKSRLPIPCQHGGLDNQMQDFLCGFLPCSGQSLEPKLWNTFRRITLVNKTEMERLTIDIDLCFSCGPSFERQALALDGIAVAEIKRDQLCRGSAFAAEMRRQGIRETGFSKYCFGVSRFYPSIKANSQKERALLIEKLQHGEQSYVCYA
jgi:hypothetical protein